MIEVTQEENLVEFHDCLSSEEYLPQTLILIQSFPFMLLQNLISFILCAS